MMGRRIRAALVALLAAAVVAAIWRLRPTGAADPTPERDIVTACAWVAWALSEYLGLAVLLSAALHARRSTAGSRPSVRSGIPGFVHRAVGAAVCAGLVTTTVAGTAAAAGSSTLVATAPASGATPSPGASQRSAQPIGSDLDWPGLAPLQPFTHRHAAARLVTTAPNRPPASDAVTVRAGDSLWSIAERALGPAVSPAAIATTWPRWYAENRDVIGSDPDLIHPGQRLLPPPAERRSPQ